MLRRKSLTIRLVTGGILIIAIAWLHIWARQASLDTEEQTRKAETCYREGIATAADALDNVRTELAVLAGKVQERGDRDGEQAAICSPSAAIKSMCGQNNSSRNGSPAPTNLTLVQPKSRLQCTICFRRSKLISLTSAVEWFEPLAL